MPTPSTVHLTVPATLQDVRVIDEALVAFLNQVGNVTAAESYQIELAVHEILTNIVVHAYAGQRNGRIDARIGVAAFPPRKLVIELRDTGKPYDPDRVRPVDLDTPHEGGYGIFLATTLLDEVKHVYQHGHNIWSLSKQL